jgi:hypothetical protein
VCAANQQPVELVQRIIYPLVFRKREREKKVSPIAATPPPPVIQPAKQGKKNIVGGKLVVEADLI